MASIEFVLAGMPKAELHMHLEGSLEADLIFELAQRNGVTLRYRNQAELEAAYNFSDLQSFLNIYYAGLAVLQHERDYYDMTWAYLARAHRDAVRHTEVFISPQAHTRRGVAFAAMMDGIIAALDDGRSKLGMTSRLIVGFQRQFPEDDAIETMRLAMPYRDRVAGVGLGGPEVGNPPEKFVRAFAQARAEGWKTMAHAGEEGPAQYVAGTVDLLKVDRVDHGVRCEDDPALVRRLAALQVPLTVCPISNVKLRVFPDLASHNIGRLLRAGVRVTINSDDPSYFGGYMTRNFVDTQAALGLTLDEMFVIARNGFTSAFLAPDERDGYLAEFDAYCRQAASA